VQDGDPDRWVVKVGQEFQCSTIPGPEGQRLEVTVACDGYEAYRGSSFEWKVEGFTCKSQHVGTIALRRAAVGPEGEGK